jgi:hypothetical protein
MNGIREERKSERRCRVFSVPRLAALLALGLLPAALFCAGCGQRSESASSTGTGDAAVSAGSETQAVNASLPAAATAAAPSPGAALQTGTPGAAPPDIDVELADTLVTAGSVIEVAVYGTADVSQIELADGTNDPQGMYLDTATNAWRVNYRVPLRPKQERIPLSVTAKNEAGRWRRVWVFLHVTPNEPQATVEAAPDSSK